MKLFKVFNVALLCMALAIVSCSGEDGADGENGLPGTNGVDGVNGTNGVDGINCWDLNGNGTGDITDGEDNEDINGDEVVDALDCQGGDGEDGTNGIDGNANVEAHIFSLDVFADYTSLNLNLNNVVDEPENYAYLFYIDSGQNGFRYSMPGSLFSNDVYSRIYTDLSSGTLFIYFHNTGDDSPYTVAGGEYTQVIAVAIELSNGSKNSENVLTSLKAAGVDTSNYKSVAAYFGLE